MNKAQLARDAIELRKDIGLDAHAMFDPYKLAEQWGIEVFQLSELDCSDAALKHLTFDRSSVFSGALIPVGTGFVILENDSHDPFRLGQRLRMRWPMSSLGTRSLPRWWTRRAAGWRRGSTRPRPRSSARSSFLPLKRASDSPSRRRPTFRSLRVSA